MTTPRTKGNKCSVLNHCMIPILHQIKFSVKDQFTLPALRNQIYFIHAMIFSEGAYKELVLGASGASHNFIQVVCKVPLLTNKNNLTGHE